MLVIRGSMVDAGLGKRATINVLNRSELSRIKTNSGVILCIDISCIDKNECKLNVYQAVF